LTVIHFRGVSIPATFFTSITVNVSGNVVVNKGNTSIQNSTFNIGGSLTIADDTKLQIANIAPSVVEGIPS